MERIEEVCRSKGLSKKEWSRAAGVSVEWLRRGVGPSIVESSHAALPAAREAPPTTMESAILEAWRRADFPTEIVVALQGLARASRTRFPERQEEASRWRCAGSVRRTDSCATGSRSRRRRSR